MNYFMQSYGKIRGKKNKIHIFANKIINIKNYGHEKGNVIIYHSFGCI